MKVLILTNVPSPYRVNFFNELGKHCDLTIIFQRQTSSERGKHWNNLKVSNFKSVFLKGLKIGPDSSLCFNIKKTLKQYKNHHIIICGFSSLTHILAIRFLKRKNIPYFIEIDGGSPFLSNKQNSIKNKIKKSVCRGATGYFSSGLSGDEYLMRYGATKDKIFRYSFSSLYKKDIMNKAISLNDKTNLKNKLSIPEKKCIITVGRFNYKNGYGKGFDVFVKLAELFKNKDIGFYIIGDAPTQHFSELKKKLELSHLHFLPFFEKENLFKYYRASDLSMILSRGDVWGLVVNESLANGTPVISSNLCLAGRELITDGYNGFVVDLNDLNTIKKRIERILNENYINISNNCLESIGRYTIEEMVKEHLGVLKENENSY